MLQEVSKEDKIITLLREIKDLLQNRPLTIINNPPYPHQHQNPSPIQPLTPNYPNPPTFIC